MKKAVGIVELLIVIIVITAIYFTCFNNKSTKNPFDEQRGIKTQQELVETKIKDIENSKAIRERIEQNLNRENY